MYKPLSVKTIDFKLAYMYIFLFILIGLGCSMAPFFGWSFYSLEGALTSCSVEWSIRSLNVISYNMFIFFITFLIPVFVIVFSNVGVLLIVRFKEVINRF